MTKQRVACSVGRFLRELGKEENPREVKKMQCFQTLPFRINIIGFIHLAISMLCSLCEIIGFSVSQREEFLRYHVPPYLG